VRHVKRRSLPRPEVACTVRSAGCSRDA